MDNVTKVAALFAGQGAQYPGMGRSLYDGSAAARAVFAMADDVFSGTSERCFTGSDETLRNTLFTQTCVCAVDLACAAALDEAGVGAQGAAGFSLGEMAALAYAGLLSQREAFALTAERARLMQLCTRGEDGAMVAVLRLDAESVRDLCRRFSGLYPANYNCPGQTVVAGERTELEKLAARVAQKGGRTVALAVGGAFHSPYMARAADGLREHVRAYRFSPPRIPLYANATAAPYDAESAAALIAAQVESPVLWEATIRRMATDGFETFVEMGPGRVLSGLVKKIIPGARICNVEDMESLRETVRELKGERVC